VLNAGQRSEGGRVGGADKAASYVGLLLLLLLLPLLPLLPLLLHRLGYPDSARAATPAASTFASHSSWPAACWQAAPDGPAVHVAIMMAA
jgi:hypothetical protein